MRSLALLTIMLFCWPAVAAVAPMCEMQSKCDEAPDENARKLCVEKLVTQADARMRVVYTRVQKSLNSTENGGANNMALPKGTIQKALAQSQQSWMTYREKNCYLEGLATFQLDGSGRFLANCKCLADYDRMNELESIEKIPGSN